MKHLLLILILAVNCIHLKAQTWNPVGTGVDHNINAMLSYGSDLYVTQDADFGHYIEKWDGTSWSYFGADLNGAIRAIAFYNGQLYVGGQFNESDSGSILRIARWDGTKWDSVGSGMNDWVYALAVYDGELYAGGSFDTAGGIAASNIAKWNGTRWDSVDIGTSGRVSTLYVSQNNELYVGGFFNLAGGISASKVAKWNGNTWSALGGGVAGEVYSFADYQGALYVGGQFTTAGGITANKIAKWDGNFWDSLGSGLTGFAGGPNALTVYNGKLYAGGEFNTAGGIPAFRIAAWNGTTWSACGNGIIGGVGIWDMLVFDNQLIVGGGFYSADTVACDNIASLSTTDGIIDNEIEEELSLSPNPSTGTLFVKSASKIYSIQIADESGKMIDLISSPINADFYLRISFENLNKGVYIAKFILDNRVVVRKIVVI